uniref:Uncharacterized protein n=1 Tax=Amphimedon queenslandica TaxID=400682 RepID=A0A1X7SXC8_AMPQE
MSLPLVYLLCYIGQYTCCTKHCIENKFNAITSPSGHNNNDDDDDELPQRLLPEFSKSYDTFSKSSSFKQCVFDNTVTFYAVLQLKAYIFVHFTPTVLK